MCVCECVYVQTRTRIYTYVYATVTSSTLFFLPLTPGIDTGGVSYRGGYYSDFTVVLQWRSVVPIVALSKLNAKGRHND
jgi:hypothetical protein